MELDRIPLNPQSDWVVFDGSCERTFKANGRDFFIRINGFTDVAQADEMLRLHAGSAEKAIAIAYMLGISDPEVNAAPVDFRNNQELIRGETLLTHIHDDSAILEWRKGHISGDQREKENLRIAQKIYNFYRRQDEKDNKGKEREEKRVDPLTQNKGLRPEIREQSRRGDSEAQAERRGEKLEGISSQLSTLALQVANLHKQIQVLENATASENSKEKLEAIEAELKRINGRLDALSCPTPPIEQVTSEDVHHLRRELQQILQQIEDWKQAVNAAHSEEKARLQRQVDELERVRAEHMQPLNEFPKREEPEKKEEVVTQPERSSCEEGAVRLQHDDLDQQLAESINQLIEFFDQERKESELLEKIKGLTVGVELSKWAVDKKMSNKKLITSYNSKLIPKILDMKNHKKSQLNEYNNEDIKKELVVLENIRRFITKHYHELCPDQQAFGALRPSGKTQPSAVQ